MEPSFYRETYEAEDWDWWHCGRRRVLAAVLDDAVRARRLPDRASFLDVGCGTGGTSVFLAQGRPLTGCDTEPRALELSARRGIDRLVLASAEALPFRDASFDVVMALDVLEHHEDDAAVAREARRVVRPGGLVLVTVPAFDSLWGPHDVISRHHRRYRLEGLVGVLSAAGLDVVLASYFNALLFPAVLTVQSLRRILRGGAPAEAASDLPKAMPRAVNAALREVFALEERWLPARRFPFGVSALALASPRER